MTRVKTQVTRSDLSEKAQPSKRKQKSEEYLKYQRYIRSRQFQEVKEIVKERDQFCQFCGRTQEDIDKEGLSFNVHHITYRHLFEGGETEAADCRLFCKICHLAAHRARSNYKRFKIKGPDEKDS